MLQFDYFRFSLSWPRLLPTGGVNNINWDGVQFYHNVLDELEKQGIKPIVTLYHWDHPQILERTFGGWLSESMAFAFAEYARFVFSEFGHRIKEFTTVNEINVFCMRAYGTGNSAPGKLIKTDNFLKCFPY